ncbi:hypothetical protein TMEN_8350 [Trichophyton mentagrophytes]|uniref:AB hydrolase-1 domain-containing protein n=2 Tax=Trichophyton interdigitale TaxID=101480 RepID=A0A9P4YE20_9EURO|nr:hypothetical protein H101_01876 [Trichophyton interdigitale H6]KAF3893098.1 AB hydrolase-1 domain-containing protein [Trichophyton interdigitale]KDB22436.1 hypothetical protein H109_05642 [Trichophyton interdigitale MR816]GBF65633.1 hypothetical protein TMEN_8350 [Trichophyton mentagrophytes]KAG5208275.1 AB hydrolase-1 domain-containing protein [Trichophyton interdigitale]
MLSYLGKKITRWLGCGVKPKSISIGTDTPEATAIDSNSNLGKTKPVILIIHGAWQHPAYYQAFVQVLQSRGYETYCPRLPSCNGQVPPTKSLQDDVQFIRQFTAQLTDAGKLVDVIMHSYGGIVGTDALCKFGIAERSRRGLAGGVRNLIYLTSFVPHKGQSLVGIFEGQSLPTVKINEETNLISATDPIPMFYSDLPSEEAEYWVKQMVAHPYSAQSTPVSNEAFRELPTSYIICDNDKGILPEVQQMMIDRLKVAGVDVQVKRCSGSHSPFLSMPNVTADIIENISNA